MKIKSIVSKTLIASLVVGSSLSAVASESALKVAVVKDFASSADILAGQFERSIKKLNKKSMVGLAFEKNMNLCVAYLKAQDFTESQAACSAAVESTEAMDLSNEKSIYLKSLSYSNRAIAKYFNDDMEGAIADLTMAAKIDENPITLENLAHIKSEYDAIDSSVMMAD